MVKYQKIYAICGMLSPIVFNLIWIIHKEGIGFSRIFETM